MQDQSPVNPRNAQMQPLQPSAVVSEPRLIAEASQAHAAAPAPEAAGAEQHIPAPQEAAMADNVQPANQVLVTLFIAPIMSLSAGSMPCNMHRKYGCAPSYGIYSCAFDVMCSICNFHVFTDVYNCPLSCPSSCFDCRPDTGRLSSRFSTGMPSCRRQSPCIVPL